MTRLLALLSMVAAIGTAHGSAPSLQVEGGATAAVTVRSARDSVTLDLHTDVLGCVGTLTDNSTGERFPAGVHWTVLDVTQAKPLYYVLLLAEAQSNCNIQGHCGASQDHTIVLLTLTRHLRLVHKQSIAIDDCYNGRLSRYWHDEAFDRSGLRFVGDVMTITFKDFREDTDDEKSVVYNRARPDLGLQVPRSPAPEQKPNP